MVGQYQHGMEWQAMGRMALTASAPAAAFCNRAGKYRERLEGFASLPRDASVHEAGRIAQTTSGRAVDLQQLVSLAC
ncbi:hypothetical protein [Noviherbaspirillum soli]|uniref:hypothetical protein n=1 Tax=Noviherbaspirillum soli TaxID=1064518 RepID=UPI00188BC92F|nr:hypothetical protein [Noviherbaspirillum soli]